MKPTRVLTLVYLGFAGVIVGFFLPKIWDALTQRYMPVSWLAAIVLWMLAIALLIWTLLVRHRLSGKPGVTRLDPILAANTVAFSMAASRTGALVAGFYVGVLIYFLPNADLSPGRARVITAIVAGVGALVFMAIALWLERICRIPEPPSDESLDKSDPLPG